MIRAAVKPASLLLNDPDNLQSCLHLCRPRDMRLSGKRPADPALERTSK